MLNRNLVILFLLSLLLPACISVSQMQSELSNAAQITKSTHDMSFLPIEEEKTQSIQFDSKSPSFLFENGKNYYAAYRIENNYNPRYLNIKTYVDHHLSLLKVSAQVFGRYRRGLKACL